MHQDLAGRVTVVTGGASGIGEACARPLAARGAKLGRRPRPAARRGGRALDGAAAEVDVRLPASVEAAARRPEGEVGPADLLVTSAGITQRPVRAPAPGMEDWDAVQEIDPRGPWFSAVAWGTPMAGRGRGSIATIASVAGMRSMPLHSYTPAKGGVIALTAEWGRSGVRVNATSPGYTRTPMLARRIRRGERDPSSPIGEPALGRLVAPEDVARAVCFPTSDEAGAIKGVNPPVDAGWLVAPSWRTCGGLPPPAAGS